MVRTINFLIVFSAVMAIYFEYVGHRMLYLVLKPLTTILVISILLFSSKTKNERFRNIISTALFFCLLGDIFLLFEGYFVFGLGSFLIAHLLFAFGFIKLEGFHFNWASLSDDIGHWCFVILLVKARFGQIPDTCFLIYFGYPVHGVARDWPFFER